MLGRLLRHHDNILHTYESQIIQKVSTCVGVVISSSSFEVPLQSENSAQTGAIKIPIQIRIGRDTRRSQQNLVSIEFVLAKSRRGSGPLNAQLLCGTSMRLGI